MTGKQVVIVLMRFDKDLTQFKIWNLQFNRELYGWSTILQWHGTKRLIINISGCGLLLLTQRRLVIGKPARHKDVSHSQFCVLLELKTFLDKNNWLQALWVSLGGSKNCFSKGWICIFPVPEFYINVLLSWSISERWLCPKSSWWRETRS